MNSPPSSSVASNGHVFHTNGLVASHTPTSSTPDILDFHQHNHHDPSSGSTYSSNGYPGPSYQTHNEDIVSHLYHAGFQTGNYADTILHVHQNAYRLHAIILSRSPFLAHLMSTSPQTGGQRVIYVPLDHEPEVTQEGFAIALGYLYSAVSLTLIRPENARAVLAAGCLLGGMDDLCQYAYDACRRSITVESINSWLDFLDTIAVPQSPSDGSATPELTPHPTGTVFGPYAQRLRDEIFNFLVVTLPDMLVGQAANNEENDAKNGRDMLLHIFSKVPFEMFKAAIESPTFDIGSDQARFKFAKDAIEIRKRGIARGAGAEETVVLAFGSKTNMNGSAVHVTRKMRKRQLWKVNA